jgi:hypothetical protein
MTIFSCMTMRGGAGRYSDFRVVERVMVAVLKDISTTPELRSFRYLLVSKDELGEEHLHVVEVGEWAMATQRGLALKADPSHMRQLGTSLCEGHVELKTALTPGHSSVKVDPSGHVSCTL